jgi:hypothetical protein
MAANFRLDRRGAWTSPWETNLPLGSGDVLIYVTFYPAGEAPSVDRHSYQGRRLPLALADANRARRMTGQPANVVRYRLLSRVDGYDVDVNVFFNARGSSAGTRAAAQAELGRLVVPEAAAVPTRTGNQAACTVSQLRGSVSLQGGAGALIGAISLENVGGSPCTLSGRPPMTLENAKGHAIRSTQTPAEPIWAYSNAPQPRGWPEVRLARHGSAIVRLGFRNWCGGQNEKVFFDMSLPGSGRLHVPANVNLRCDVPGAPAALSVGPFEPPS